VRSLKDCVIKICGITRLDDAQHAVREGATALGFVFWPESPRVVGVAQAAEIIEALPSGITPVGVFVNESAAQVRDVMRRTGIKVVQLHGDERPEDFDLRCPILKSVTLDAMADAFHRWPTDTTWLLDAADPVRRGGTGVQIDWDRAHAAARQYKVVLAGGLTPANVEEAIRTVQPFGVDVSSGVESSPGIKNAEKVTSFVMNARRAFVSMSSQFS
jgi:phosphoribosylanthranilate isomerase